MSTETMLFFDIGTLIYITRASLVTNVLSIYSVITNSIEGRNGGDYDISIS